MSGSNPDIDFTTTRKIAANLIASAFCNGGTEAFLDAQADLLRGVENAMTDWLHRRQEAVEDAYRLIARVRDSRDVGDIWKAQQDWASGAWQRFAADVTAYPVLLASAGERVTEATAQSVGEAAQETKKQLSEVRQRMAEVPAKAGRAVRGAMSEAAKAPTAEEASTH